MTQLLDEIDAIRGLVDFAMAFGEAKLFGISQGYSISFNDPNGKMTNNLIRLLESIDGIEKKAVCSTVVSYTDKTNEKQIVIFYLLTDEGVKLHGKNSSVDLTIIMR